MEKKFNTAESSTIFRIKHLAEKSTLEVEFRNGAIYHYLNVPDRVVQAAFGAAKISAFLNSDIKGVYQYHKVG